MKVHLGRRLSYLLRRDRAQRLAADGDYAAAMIEIRLCYGVLGLSFPSPDAPIELNLMAGLLALRLEGHEQAIWCATLAVAALREGRGRYSPAERSHLDIYARKVGNRAAWEARSSSPWSGSWPSEPKVGFVRLRIRKAFPLRPSSEAPEDARDR